MKFEAWYVPLYFPTSHLYGCLFFGGGFAWFVTFCASLAAAHSNPLHLFQIFSEKGKTNEEAKTFLKRQCPKKFLKNTIGDPYSTLSLLILSIFLF
jgi:hypothetical protein